MQLLLSLGSYCYLCFCSTVPAGRRCFLDQCSLATECALHQSPGAPPCRFTVGRPNCLGELSLCLGVWPVSMVLGSNQADQWQIRARLAQEWTFFLAQRREVRNHQGRQVASYDYIVSNDWTKSRRRGSSLFGAHRYRDETVSRAD